MADQEQLARIVAMIQGGKVAAARSPFPERAGNPYRPSSGTEGFAFQEWWCDHCARDAAFRADENAEGCPIVAATFVYEKTDPRYPKEWVYDSNGVPCCTAFTTDPTQPWRCDKTIDMFEGEKEKRQC